MRHGRKGFSPVASRGKFLVAAAESPLGRSFSLRLHSEAKNE